MKFAVSSLNRQDGDSHRINQDHCRYLLIHTHAILNDVVFLIVRIIHIQYRHLENYKKYEMEKQLLIFLCISFQFLYLYVNVYVYIFMHSQFFTLLELQYAYYF